MNGAGIFMGIIRTGIRQIRQVQVAGLTVCYAVAVGTVVPHTALSLIVATTMRPAATTL